MKYSLMCRLVFLAIIMGLMGVISTVWSFAQVGNNARGAADEIGGPDTFGYTFLDQNAAECPFQFIDIRATGMPVSFTASDAAPAADDGGAVVLLQEPFEFYGRAVSKVVMSSNGYLAFAANLAEEDGGDFSNDCDLPAIPGNNAGVNARLMAYHDELDGGGNGGAAHVEFFKICPRLPASGDDEACTIFQWTDWALLNSAETFDFQVILYHASFEAGIQIQPGDSSAGSGATVGIQNAVADSALPYACNTPDGAPGGTAVCFFEPRFPGRLPETDLSVTKTSPTSGAVPGTSVQYTVEVSNDGPNPVAGATVSDSFAFPLLNCEWTCTPSRGSSCSAGPVAGDLVDAVHLEVGGSATYTIDCDVDANAFEAFANTVTVAVPELVVDTDPANDRATVIHELCLLPQAFFDGVNDWPDLATVLDLVTLVPPCPAP